MASTTPTQVIANAARLRGLTPRAVGKQILAAKFLRETYPGRIGSGQVRGGYSQIEYLAKIHQLDPARADRLVGPVLSAEVSMAQMRAAYDEVVASIGGPTSSTAKAKQRGLAFESACEAAIKANGEFFQLTSGASLVADYRLVDTVLDFAVLRDGFLVSAVEVRIGGLASAKREASALTARLALLASRVESSKSSFSSPRKQKIWPKRYRSPFAYGASNGRTLPQWMRAPRMPCECLVLHCPMSPRVASPCAQEVRAGRPAPSFAGPPRAVAALILRLYRIMRFVLSDIAICKMFFVSRALPC